jgi:hypothetical protein
MAEIIGPVTVTKAHLRYPIRWAGVALYVVETEKEQYFASEAPLFRGQDGQPLTLTEEVWAGSEIKLALTDRGLISAVQVLRQQYYNPFAAA